MSTISKTQQFTYLQNKARHYEHLRKIKPTLNTFRTLSPPKSLSSYKHSINMPIMKQYEEMKINESLVNGILEIRQSSKSYMCRNNGYSRFNDSIQKNDRNRQSSVKFRELSTKNQIQRGNNTLGNRLLNVKPSIGTMAQWNKRHENNKSLKKIASRYAKETFNISDDKVNLNNYEDSHRKVLSIYSKAPNRFIPEHYRTFMDRDGSTVALRQKLFQLPKQLQEDYLRRERSRRTVKKQENAWKFNEEILKNPNKN